MSRSKWKGPYINKNNLNETKQSKKHYLIPRIARDTTIVPSFVNKTFEIYNGKNFTELFITDEMIGHKFGEFSTTRKRFSFKKKIKK